MLIFNPNQNKALFDSPFLIQRTDQKIFYRNEISKIDVEGVDQVNEEILSIIFGYPMGIISNTDPVHW